jgi:hypothetical protein
LGDTLDQSTARYGQPLGQGKGDASSDGYPWYAFKSGKFEIEERFSSGIVIAEIYWVIPLASNGPFPTYMTERQQEEILLVESGKAKWARPEVTKVSTRWLRDDGALALYSGVHNKMKLSAPQLNH